MATAQQQQTRYTLTFTVPPSHVSACKEAVFAAGAGVHYLPSQPQTPIENNNATPAYTNVCYTYAGTGEFIPAANANPVIGERGEREVVQEVRCEVLCFGEEVVRGAVRGLRGAHPYEVPVYYVYKLEEF